MTTQQITTLADEVRSIVFAFDSGDSRRDAVRELADRVSSLESKLAEARAVLRAVLAVLERGPRYTDRHLEAAADSVVEEIREAIALASGAACEYCGSTNWDVTATLIGCRGCGVVYGRVNGGWVLDLDTVPWRKYDLQGLDPHEL